MEDQKRLARIEEKVDAINDRVHTLAAHMDVYNEQLKIHIEGTVQNRSDIKNIQRHVLMVEGVIKFIGMVTGVTALIAAIKTLIR